MSEDEPTTDEYRTGWSNAPSAKAKNAVQKAVTALLDALAPESTGSARRVDDPKGTTEQARTAEPRIPQTGNAALDVSLVPRADGRRADGRAARARVGRYRAASRTAAARKAREARVGADPEPD